MPLLIGEFDLVRVGSGARTGGNDGNSAGDTDSNCSSDNHSDVPFIMHQHQ